MNILSKFQLPSSSGLGLTVIVGDCRTAPATPGLLNRQASQTNQFLNQSLHIAITLETISAFQNSCLLVLNVLINSIICAGLLKI